MQHIDIGALLAEQGRIQRRLSHIEEERRALEARLAEIVRVTQPLED